MKPLDQTTFNPKGGLPDTGNCFQASMASLLELPLSEVPHFYQKEEDPVKAEENIKAWLALRDLVLVEITFIDDKLYEFPCAHLLSGPSPRGDFFHTVVARSGKVIHDPHPSRDGLASYEGAYYGFLVSLKPELAKENQ